MLSLASLRKKLVLAIPPNVSELVAVPWNFAFDTAVESCKPGLIVANPESAACGVNEASLETVATSVLFEYNFTTT